jgi:NitT/TauT family transport system substrate-binding protein
MRAWTQGRGTTRWLTGMAGAILVMCLLAACGGDGSQPEEAGGKTSLTVGVMATADLAPMYMARKRGLFADEGLTVEPIVAAGGATQIASMVAGDIDITYSNYVSVLEAAKKGLPLRIIRENNRSGPQGIYAMADSGIAKPADLAGTKIAVNSLGNIQELTARAVLQSYGVDPSTLTFVELPPPDMLSALEQRNVDAAWLVEPFVTLASQTSDVARVVSAFEGPTENLPVAGWTATEQFVQENPEAVAAFVRAMDRAMSRAQAHPKALEQTIPGYTDISPGLARQLTEPGLATRSDLSDLDDLEALMVEHGIIDGRLDLDQVVVRDDELPRG